MFKVSWNMPSSGCARELLKAVVNPRYARTTFSLPAVTAAATKQIRSKQTTRDESTQTCGKYSKAALQRRTC